MIGCKISALFLSHAHVGWFANLWFAQSWYKWRICHMLLAQSQQSDKNYLPEVCKNNIIFLTICNLPCLKDRKWHQIRYLSSHKDEFPNNKTAENNTEQYITFYKTHLEHSLVVVLICLTSTFSFVYFFKITFYLFPSYYL